MDQHNIHILLINCPDESGLIFKVSKIVYGHQLNVVSNGEFVERKFNHFFMRTEFSGKINKEILLEEVKSVLPPSAEVRLTANTCLLYTSPSPRDGLLSRMPSSA